jgi:glycosyltransferase involved in cell wall biosynthesis
MDKLIFDPITTGHHIEFLWNLIQLHTREKEEGKVLFVVGNGFVTKAKEAYGDFELDLNNYSITEITKRESRLIRSHSSLIRQIFHFLIMLKYARRIDAKKVIILDLNQMLKALYISLYFLSFEITGILFNGNKFYELQGIKERLFNQLFSDSKFKKIFILNGDEIANSLNFKFRTKIFSTIPDPLAEINLNEFKKERNEKVVLLYIGSVTKRKGIDVILDSFKEISSDISKHYQLRIFGVVDDLIKTNVNESIEEIKRTNNLDIVFKPHFISHSIFITQLVNCDYVLTLYRDAEISSGILGYSTLLNKDLIGTNLGFIGIKYLKIWNGHCITPNKDEFKKLLNTPLVKSYKELIVNEDYKNEHSYRGFYKLLNE